MGFSVRTFILKNEELRRFSHARFERLVRRDPKESLPEHAGTYACFATAYITTVDGEPAQFEHVEYVRIKIGADGRVDEHAQLRSYRLAAESVDFSAFAPSPPNVISAPTSFIGASITVSSPGSRLQHRKSASPA